MKFQAPKVRYILIYGESLMEMEYRINSSSERATWETSPDLCRTFGALFRDDLETLG